MNQSCNGSENVESQLHLPLCHSDPPPSEVNSTDEGTPTELVLPSSQKSLVSSRTTLFESYAKRGHGSKQSVTEGDFSSGIALNRVKNSTIISQTQDNHGVCLNQNVEVSIKLDKDDSVESKQEDNLAQTEVKEPFTDEVDSLVTTVGCETPKKETLVEDSSPSTPPVSVVPAKRKSKKVKSDKIGAEYPEHLNPFGDDSEESEEPKVSSNPFSSDSDDEPTGKIITQKTPPGRNPFGSDSEEDAPSVPVPLPRTSKFATASETSLPRNSWLRGSNRSLASVSSISSYRKKRPAPQPPASPGNIPSPQPRSPAPSRASISSTGSRCKKKGKAPPPPPIPPSSATMCQTIKAVDIENDSITQHIIVSDDTLSKATSLSDIYISSFSDNDGANPENISTRMDASYESSEESLQYSQKLDSRNCKENASLNDSISPALQNISLSSNEGRTNDNSYDECDPVRANVNSFDSVECDLLCKTPIGTIDGTNKSICNDSKDMTVPSDLVMVGISEDLESQSLDEPCANIQDNTGIQEECGKKEKEELEKKLCSEKKIEQTNESESENERIIEMGGNVSLPRDDSIIERDFPVVSPTADEGQTPQKSHSTVNSQVICNEETKSNDIVNKEFLNISNFKVNDTVRDDFHPSKFPFMSTPLQVCQVTGKKVIQNKKNNDNSVYCYKPKTFGEYFADEHSFILTDIDIDEVKSVNKKLPFEEQHNDDLRDKIGCKNADVLCGSIGQNESSTINEEKLMLMSLSINKYGKRIVPLPKERQSFSSTHSSDSCCEDTSTSPTEKQIKDSANLHERNSGNENKYVEGEGNKNRTLGSRRKKGRAPTIPGSICESKDLTSLRSKLRPDFIIPSMEEVRQQLHDIEVKQQGLERQGIVLEERIRQRFNSEENVTPYVEDLIIQLFELVNEKNELFRKQTELMYMRRQRQLEIEQTQLELQIRTLMSQPEVNKTDSDKEMEEYLISRLLGVVEKRDAIVQCLESDRLREAEEDKSINNQINLFSKVDGEREKCTATISKQNNDFSTSLEDVRKDRKTTDKEKKWLSLLRH